VSRLLDQHGDRLLALVSEGVPLVQACVSLGVNDKTAAKWVERGRREPDGRYGPWVKRLDAIRSANGNANLPIDTGGDRPAGPVETTLEALLAEREPHLGPEQRLSAQEARCLARVVDELSKAKGGAAALGLVSASKRLDELIAALELPKEDAIDRLQAAYAARKTGQEEPAQQEQPVLELVAAAAPPLRKKVSSNGHAKHEIKSRDW
jgi:hypothetical protein